MNDHDELFQLMLGRTTTKAVERILAAGYRKPRTITTVEQIQELAEGSVLLDRNGHTLRFDGYYWLLAGLVDYFRSGEIALPATVLHEPASK